MFATKFVTPRRKRRRPYNMYIYINDQYVELSRFSHVRLSVYIRTSPSVFKISFLNFANVIFSSRSCSFVGTADIGPLYHIAAIQTERSESSSCMENFHIWQDIFTKFGIDYFLRQQCNLRRNCSDRLTIAYSCHTNWTIGSKILYGKLWH